MRRHILVFHKKRTTQRDEKHLTRINTCYNSDTIMVLIAGTSAIKPKQLQEIFLPHPKNLQSLFYLSSIVLVSRSYSFKSSSSHHFYRCYKRKIYDTCHQTTALKENQILYPTVINTCLHFEAKLKCFGYFLRVQLQFGKILNLLCKF